MKADVWSLGVTMYKLMCFRYPFDGDTKDEYKRKVQHTKTQVRDFEFDFNRGAD